MIHKKLKELYLVDTISQDKGWKKVREKVGEFDDDILIDFTGINIVEPWNSLEFKQLLKETNVHMLFTNNTETAKRIQIMCILDGLDHNRIIDKSVEPPKEKTAAEKAIEQRGEALIEYFKIDGDKAVFNVRDKYSQVQNNSTIDYIDYAIRKLHKEKGIKEFTLIIRKMYIILNVIEILAEVMVKYESEGITLNVDVDNEEIKKNLELSLHKATNEKYDNKTRYKTIKNSITPNTCGMLIKYKKSRALDEFGRHGKGEVVSSRIAIFRGFKKSSKSDVPLMVVETYNNNTFYTKQHWAVDHDNEMSDGLESDIVEMKIDEVGFCDYFLGTQYHFLMPIQQSKEETQMVIEAFDENGRNIKKYCTIPERMKIVFDNWGIKYNKESLDEAILKTREFLDSLD